MSRMVHVRHVLTISELVLLNKISINVLINLPSFDDPPRFFVLKFGTRVIYGGTVFLLALSLFLLQVWHRHQTIREKEKTNMTCHRTTSRKVVTTPAVTRIGSSSSSGSGSPEAEVMPLIVNSGRISHRLIVWPEHFYELYHLQGETTPQQTNTWYLNPRLGGYWFH